MKRALLIGINKYPYGNTLNCCINDVTAMKEMLSINFDESPNFSVRELLDEDATRSNIRREINKLFSEQADVALLYFSGHGYDDKNDGVIVSSDCEEDDYGIGMTEILGYANNSNCTNKIIILDCCHSGKIGNYSTVGDASVLKDGVIIFTACSKSEPSLEVNGHGMFTNLLIEALKGGASDLLGRTTPGAIYSYIDQSLGPWDQRPYFKANVSRFISLRNNEEKILLKDLREMINLFADKNFEYNLDPSYEKTNIEGSDHKTVKPYATDENIKKFGILQKYNRLGLLVPIGEVDMYFAAMNSKSCILTPLGKHYWNLIKNKMI